jgi:hypothetical protein
VVAEEKNTRSCGLKGNFQKLDVHNLFIHHLPDPISKKPSRQEHVPQARLVSGELHNKKGENFTLLPLLLKFLEQELS